ncbi:uncharacterized protein LY89DRAFT_666263 [Mollisia scopiformis]|uniref:YDG domain-containing protein n=1 Tax=Mollisia scopiformis TaxID=149040 RepID=A0A194XLF0_MOLSC|nr:uncharacterized protein LY89DRAFT_666263 [Mollisia scopiformis]KUJ20602.1 hypothetical protein LY89DRAFT_666263 [Mollisia scopiformis]
MSDTNFDLEAVIIALVPENIRSKPLDLTITKLVELKDVIKITLVRSKRYGSWDNGTEDGRNAIKELIWLYLNNKDLGAQFKGAPVYAESVLDNFANPLFNLPLEVLRCGEALKWKFEFCNWGIVECKNEDDTSKATSKKRKSDALEDNEEGSSALAGAKNSAIAAQPQGVFVKAPDNHPIFGLNGIMHHIEATKSGKKSYRVSAHYAGRDFRKFGDNGFTVGDCWALQIAALRDGVHGHRIAGICGTPDSGVYSIIVAGTYADSDQDNGDKLDYAAANAEESTALTADRTNNGTKSLLRSITTKKPIRVLRTSTSKWPKAPKAGLRYDGLYEVTGSEEKTNKKGGKYISFKLVRIAGQVEIATDRPTRAEKRAIRAVQRGY